MPPDNPTQPRPGRDLIPYIIVVLVATAVYVGASWTPSSYGVVLERIGATDSLPAFGQPRVIRNDEWGVWTPFVQATVGNGYRRTNDTSIYREDLRNFNGLPLFDWSIAFKPYFWWFPIGDAARAFSLYHAFIMVAFLLGYPMLLRSWGFGTAVSALAGLALFFAGLTQTWWTTLGPVFAGFPWIVMVVGNGWRPWIKMPVLAWLAASWLFAHLYPPVLVTLPLAAFLLLWAFRPSSLRAMNLAVSALGVAIGAGIVWFYLRDVIPAMSNTIYPGNRAVAEFHVPPVQWLGQLFPFLPNSGFTPLAGLNVCEVSTLGSFLPLIVLILVDHRALFRQLATPGDERLRRILLILGGGVVVTAVWILFPVTEWLGRVIPGTFLHANRIWFASGILLFVTALTVLEHVPLRVTPTRTFWLVMTILGAWWVSETVVFGGSVAASWREILIVLPLLAVPALRRGKGRPVRAYLLTCVAAANLIVWGPFNPIQSARPIFDRPDTAATRALEALARTHPEGWLVVGGRDSWAASQNGLGFASAAHVLLAPRLERFREWMPELPEDEFNFLFNRFLRVQPTARTRPRLVGSDFALVPASAYGAPGMEVRIVDDAPPESPVDGVLEQRFVERDADAGQVLEISGWAPYRFAESGPVWTVYTGLPIVEARAYPYLRPEIADRRGDPALLLSGVTLRLRADPDGVEPWSRAPICVTVSSGHDSTFELRTRWNRSACEEIRRVRSSTDGGNRADRGRSASDRAQP